MCYAVQYVPTIKISWYTCLTIKIHLKLNRKSKNKDNNNRGVRFPSGHCLCGVVSQFTPGAHCLIINQLVDDSPNIHHTFQLLCQEVHLQAAAFNLFNIYIIYMNIWSFKCEGCNSSVIVLHNSCWALLINPCSLYVSNQWSCLLIFSPKEWEVTGDSPHNWLQSMHSH